MTLLKFFKSNQSSWRQTNWLNQQKLPKPWQILKKRRNWFLILNYLLPCPFFNYVISIFFWFALNTLPTQASPTQKIVFFSPRPSRLLFIPIESLPLKIKFDLLMWIFPKSLLFIVFLNKGGDHHFELLHTIQEISFECGLDLKQMACYCTSLQNQKEMCWFSTSETQHLAHSTDCRLLRPRRALGLLSFN